MNRRIPVNESGRRIGEGHQLAKLCDYDIDLMRRLHEEGWGYRRLARKFEIGKSQVRRIVHYEGRAQVPASFKAVPLTRR